MNKHAKLIEQYAKDWAENDKPWKLWECTHISSGEILPLIDHPKWEAHCNYRRKKQTININGYEVPEPECEELVIGTKYFTPLSIIHYCNKGFSWIGDKIDEDFLKQGIIHLSYDAAKLHRNALLSFTDGTGTKVHSNASRTSFFGSAVDLSEMLRSDAIEKSKYFDIAELHMKVLVDNILKGLGKNG